MVAKNVEIKARLHSKERYDAVCSIAEKLSGTKPTILVQEDTFFEASLGRLKLRILGKHDGQLICYDRLNIKGPKVSTYDIFETKEPTSLRRVLQSSLGSLGTVEKTRKLYMLGQTRVHCDSVLELGFYIELEVVLQDSQSAEEGQAIAKDIMMQLEIRPEDLIDVAYLDLLREKRNRPYTVEETVVVQEACVKRSKREEEGERVSL